MPIQEETRHAGAAAGLGLNAFPDGECDSENAPKLAITQAVNCPAHVIEAKREMLRDFAHEAAMQASDHAAILARYIAMDDTAGLKYSAAKFVAFARETAKTCRELIDARAI
jgi:hypothetical protein